MSFSNGLDELGLGELGLGEMGLGEMGGHRLMMRLSISYGLRIGYSS